MQNSVKILISSEILHEKFVLPSSMSVCNFIRLEIVLVWWTLLILLCMNICLCVANCVCVCVYTHTRRCWKFLGPTYLLKSGQMITHEIFVYFFVFQIVFFNWSDNFQPPPLIICVSVFVIFPEIKDFSDILYLKCIGERIECLVEFPFVTIM